MGKYALILKYLDKCFMFSRVSWKKTNEVFTMRTFTLVVYLTRSLGQVASD